VDAVLGFGILHQLEPRANCLWILLKYSLAVLCSIERHLKLIRTRYESLSPAFANWLTTTYTQLKVDGGCQENTATLADARHSLMEYVNLYISRFVCPLTYITFDSRLT
jgi:hypothetical protein